MGLPSEDDRDAIDRAFAELVARYWVPIGDVKDENGGTSEKVGEAHGRVRPVMQREVGCS